MTHADTASNLVLGDRNAAYGDPTADFTRVAAGWSALFGITVTAKQALLAMVWLKLCREVHAPKDDNLVDAHGYLLLAGWVESGTAPTPEAATLRDQLAAANDTIESVCTGERLTCGRCGCDMPCLCL